MSEWDAEEIVALICVEEKSDSSSEAETSTSGVGTAAVTGIDSNIGACWASVDLSGVNWSGGWILPSIIYFVIRCGDDSAGTLAVVATSAFLMDFFAQYSR